MGKQERVIEIIAKMTQQAGRGGTVPTIPELAEMARASVPTTRDTLRNLPKNGYLIDWRGHQVTRVPEQRNPFPSLAESLKEAGHQPVVKVQKFKTPPHSISHELLPLLEIKEDQEIQVRTEVTATQMSGPIRHELLVLSRPLNELISDDEPFHELLKRLPTLNIARILLMQESIMPCPTELTYLLEADDNRPVISRQFVYLDEENWPLAMSWMTDRIVPGLGYHQFGNARQVLYEFSTLLQEGEANA